MRNLDDELTRGLDWSYICNYAIVVLQIRSKMDSASFLPVKPAVFLILLAVADQPRHGYGIMLDVQSRSHGTISLGTSHLYRHLKRLLRDGLVDETTVADDRDPRRRYYHLTPLGREVVGAEGRRLRELIQQTEQLGLISDGHGAS